MKKLIMFVAVATLAIITQAAQFEWSLSQVREGWDDNTVKADGTAYLFLVSETVTEASIASAISSASDAASLATTLQSKAIDSSSLTAGTGGSTTGALSATAPANLFVVVLSDDGHAYKTAAQTVTTIEALGPTSVAFGSQKNASSVSTAWTNVSGGSGGIPEPTSALLLLMGGAVLALRRKQK